MNPRSGFTSRRARSDIVDHLLRASTAVATPISTVVTKKPTMASAFNTRSII
jgi:hypothetical protein